MLVRVITATGALTLTSGDAKWYSLAVSYELNIHLL